MEKQERVRRIRTIEGHIRGIERMMDDDAYCIDVALADAEMAVLRLHDASCRSRLEQQILENPGVVSARTNLASEQVLIQHIPTAVTQREIRIAIREAGFEPISVEIQFEDAERRAREDAVRHQRTLLAIGAALTIPVFIMSMVANSLRLRRMKI